MNTFCVLLTDAIHNKFNVDAKVFVSQKKKHIHLSLKKPLYECPDHRRIVSFIKKYFEDRVTFCSFYVLNFPRLNQSIKWRHHYIIAVKRKNRK